MNKIKEEGPFTYSVILAGGAGTRFWPLSREKMPKQFLTLIGEESLLQQTVNRVRGLGPLERMIVVTSQSQVEETRLQLAPNHQGQENKPCSVIIEPRALNTAPAIGLAAVFVRRLDPDGVMVVLPSDHYIRDQEKFSRDIETAVQAAREGHLVTLGIPPTRPETGFGYIEYDSAPNGKKNYRSVISFREKPDLRTAQGYLSKGNYLWNSGMFIWKAAAILTEIGRHLPGLAKSLGRVEQVINEVGGPSYPCATDLLETREMTQAIEEIYREIEPISIDYGVMEKSKNVVVVPAAFDWSDVGSFSALFDLLPRDGQGNVISGRVFDLESENSLIRGDRRLLATVGLKDLIVVDTEDAVLVCARDRAQEVRRIVEQIKDKGGEESIIHRTVKRPWGFYTVLDQGDKFKVKRVVVNPNARLSLQIHHHRSEHWVVVSGTARVTVADRIFDLHPGESTFVPASARHRIENPGVIPVVIVEAQYGEYLGEDDIVRFDDDYGRVVKD